MFVSPFIATGFWGFGVVSISVWAGLGRAGPIWAGLAGLGVGAGLGQAGPG